MTTELTDSRTSHFTGLTTGGASGGSVATGEDDPPQPDNAAVAKVIAKKQCLNFEVWFVTLHIFLLNEIGAGSR